MINHNIYLITSPSGNQYIGQTIRTIDKRWQVHYWNAHSGYDGTLYRAIRKYGKDNFSITPLITNIDTQKEANIFEQLMIARFDTYNNGYNITKGGDGTVGWKMSQETKSKISLANKGRKPPQSCIINSVKSRIGKSLSEEHKRKISESNIGKVMSEEARRKISESNMGRVGVWTGKVRPEETRQRISKSHIGIYSSSETKQKMSLSKKGIIFSDKHKESLSIAAKKFWERKKAQDRSNFVKTEYGKTCGKCLEFKEYTEYYNPRDFCKKCVRERSRKYK